MYNKITTRPHQIKVNAPGVKKFDFVRVGALKGFAFTDAEEDTGDVVIVIAGLMGDAPIVAADGAVSEGDYLVWDPDLNDGAGAFTPTGATAASHDGIAGHGVEFDADADGVGDVWLGLY